MKFSRRGIRTFVSGDKVFRIIRPSGGQLVRRGLALTSPERDLNVRTDGLQVWLLDDEREIAFAVGEANRWRLLIGRREFDLHQPKPGAPHTALMQKDSRVGEVSGRGFPLRSFELTVRAGLSPEEVAFVAMISVLGRRESDRLVLGAGGAGGGGAGG